jgi:ribosome-binding protein aMBF1 (putative translation factor)
MTLRRHTPAGPLWRQNHGPSPGGAGKMTRKFIPAEEVAKEWMKDPEFVAACDALEEEFAVASALIKARGEAGMTQEQVAQAIGTTQAAVARLESGLTMPSTRTLKRFATATHTRLRISFEPVKPEQPATRSPGRRKAMAQERRSGD